MDQLYYLLRLIDQELIYLEEQQSNNDRFSLALTKSQKPDEEEQVMQNKLKRVETIRESLIFQQIQRQNSLESSLQNQNTKNQNEINNHKDDIDFQLQNKNKQRKRKKKNKEQQPETDGKQIDQNIQPLGFTKFPINLDQTVQQVAQDDNKTQRKRVRKHKKQNEEESQDTKTSIQIFQPTSSTTDLFQRYSNSEEFLGPNNHNQQIINFQKQSIDYVCSTLSKVRVIGSFAEISDNSYEMPQPTQPDEYIKNNSKRNSVVQTAPEEEENIITNTSFNEIQKQISSQQKIIINDFSVSTNKSEVSEQFLENISNFEADNIEQIQDQTDRNENTSVVNVNQELKLQNEDMTDEKQTSAISLAEIQNKQQNIEKALKQFDSEIISDITSAILTEHSIDNQKQENSEQNEQQQNDLVITNKTKSDQYIQLSELRDTCNQSIENYTGINIEKEDNTLPKDISKIQLEQQQDTNSIKQSQDQYSNNITKSQLRYELRQTLDEQPQNNLSLINYNAFIKTRQQKLEQIAQQFKSLLITEQQLYDPQSNVQDEEQNIQLYQQSVNQQNEETQEQLTSQQLQTQQFQNLQDEQLCESQQQQFQQQQLSFQYTKSQKIDSKVKFQADSMWNTISGAHRKGSPQLYINVQSFSQVNKKRSKNIFLERSYHQLQHSLCELYNLPARSNVFTSSQKLAQNENKHETLQNNLQQSKINIFSSQIVSPIQSIKIKNNSEENHTLQSNLDESNSLIQEISSTQNSRLPFSPSLIYYELLTQKGDYQDIEEQNDHITSQVQINQNQRLNQPSSILNNNNKWIRYQQYEQSKFKQQFSCYCNKD